MARSGRSLLVKSPLLSWSGQWNLREYSGVSAVFRNTHPRKKT